MNRHLRFALEVAVGLSVSIAGAWVADRFNRKANRQAQATERIAVALERRQSIRIIIRPTPPEPEPCADTMVASACSLPTLGGTAVER